MSEPATPQPVSPGPSGSAAEDANGRALRSLSPAESEELSQKWDSQFKEIQLALAQARKRHQSELEPVESATSDAEKVQKLMELLDLKNLALEGMDAKAKEHVQETASLVRQLAEARRLYFNALVLNMKMNNLFSGRSSQQSKAGANVDSQQLFEQCMQQKIAINDWPNFVSKHF